MVSQVPPPILLLRDFNAPNSLWGCVDTNAKGLEVATFLIQSNLCLLNKKDITYIHPATGSRSSIDLGVCDPALFLDISWNVNLCGSDHFPVILSTYRSAPLGITQRWNMQKAEWDSYKLLCEDRLSYEKIGKSTNSIESFSSVLLGVANETIPKTSKQAHKRSVPWFNDSCKMAVTERKKSLQ